MTRTLAIAARELRERWILFPAAFVIGCLPLAMPAFGLRSDHAEVVGVFGAVLLGVAAAVVIGSSMLARDAASGRLGFLFSRPVSWQAVWGGKWLAALVLVFSSGLLAAVPWMVFYPPPEAAGGSWPAALADPRAVALAFALALLAVGLANFNATAFRSRSPWVVLDLLLALAAAWAARAALAPLGWYGFLGGAWGAPVLAGLAALALVVGSIFQVAVGRTDLSRAHRALSLGAWAVVWAVLASAAGVVAWVRAAGPPDVRAFAVTRGPAGRWVYLEGSARVRGFYPSGYLIDTASGRYLRTPDEGNLFGPGLLFSADGRLAALPRRGAQERGTTLALLDLAAPRPQVRLVALENSPPFEPWSSRLALSPSGGQVFLVHSNGASVYALPSGRRVATTTLPPGLWPAEARFTQRGARAWLQPAFDARATPRAEMRVVDLSPDGAAASRAFATAERLTGAGTLVADAEGARIVTFDAGLTLRDGADGRPIARLTQGEAGDRLRSGGLLAAAFLADGRVVALDAAPRTEGTQPRIAVFDASGARRGEAGVELPPAGLAVGPELAAGRVVLSSHRTPLMAVPGDGSLVFDVDALRVVGSVPGLRPAVGFFGTAAVPAGTGPQPVQLFRDTEGRVVRVDTASGERKVVAGPGAPSGERLRW